MFSILSIMLFYNSTYSFVGFENREQNCLFTMIDLCLAWCCGVPWDMLGFQENATACFIMQQLVFSISHKHFFLIFGN